MKFDRRLLPRRSPFAFFRPALIIVAVVIAVVIGAVVWRLIPGSGSGPAGTGSQDYHPRPLARDELAFLISDPQRVVNSSGRFSVAAGPGRNLTFFTTLDSGLQAFAVERLSNALAPVAAAVVIRPSDGRVLTLAWHNSSGEKFNPALEARFPAASVFKMVTAAAALEKGGLNPASTIAYNGKAHTIYRGQLKERTTKWTRRPTLAEAFGKSVNPVFGKLADRLGPEKMAAQAARMGFNTPPGLEISAGASTVEVPEEKGYQLSLVGAGFHRTNTLSPVHAALMAASVLTDGDMVNPSIIDRVELQDRDRPVRVVYRGPGGPDRKVMSSETAAAMRKLMAATVKRGTARKTFRRARRDKVLKYLELGGKTGSINDADHRYRCDWYVGYARGKKGGPAAGEEIALAVLVAHDLEKRGIKAAEIARRIIRRHFQMVMQTRKAAEAQKRREAKKKAEAAKAPARQSGS